MSVTSNPADFTFSDAEGILKREDEEFLLTLPLHSGFREVIILSRRRRRKPKSSQEAPSKALDPSKVAHVGEASRPRLSTRGSEAGYEEEEEEELQGRPRPATRTASSVRASRESRGLLPEMGDEVVHRSPASTTPVDPRRARRGKLRPKEGDVE